MTDAHLLSAMREAIPWFSDEYHAKLLAAIEPLWNLLDDHSQVDSFGGAQSARVIPAAIHFILMQANDLDPRYSTAPTYMGQPSAFSWPAEPGVTR